MSDGHLRNRISVYIHDGELDELRERAKMYDVPISRLLTDSWRIAKHCKCKVPKGCILFAEERGMRNVK